MTRMSFALWLFAFPLAAPAATCTWNTASGNWSVVANWTGCADGGGTSTRSPGANDIAVLVNGSANLDVSPSVAQFELGSNGVLSVVGDTRTFDVANALRFAGGRATTVLGSNQLLLKLHAGGTAALLATTTLENATFFENSGAATLGSASGSALTVLVASEVRNMPGGTITMSGGNSRLYLDGSSSLINNLGATFTISGNALIGRLATPSSGTIVHNLGTMVVNGPGTLNMPLGASFANFWQYGDLTVNNATLVCSASATDKCNFRDSNTQPTGSITRLVNATLELGGPTINTPLTDGSTLTGTGTINSMMTVRGKIAPGALSGPPYGALIFTGALTLNPSAIIDFDLGGSTAGSYDRIQVGGVASVGTATTFDGYGRLVLRLAAGYAPALGAAVPVMSYASVQPGAQFNRIDANYALDYAARFDPTTMQVFPAPRITIDSPSMIEGSSGITPMPFNMHLSQASSQPVAVELRARDGSAVYGGTPSGDYLFADDNIFTFAPGETLKTASFRMNGDTVVEGDEAFSVDLYRNKLINAAIGNGISGNLVGIGTILTDELPPSTRFVLVGKDNSTVSHKVRRYTTTGTFIDAWDDRMGSVSNWIITGLCFSPTGTVLATRFAAPGPILYSRVGAIIDDEFATRQGYPSLQLHESCVYDRLGNVYVGIAGINASPDTSVPVRKYNTQGDYLESFVVPTGTRGTDWIDLAGDQCTLYYTSEDTSIRRYNVCTHAALPVFAAGLTPPYCYALRLRPNREVMVACQEAVHRLSAQGDNIHTYTRTSIGETNANGLFAMNLDPDGTSFWTAGGSSGNVYHVDIASGAVLGSFNSGAGGVAGLAIYDEPHDDVIFADGFDPPPALAPIVPREPMPEADCEGETRFWPEVSDMPPFIPTWMSVISVHDDEECEE
jgi:hypothetical protein